MPTHHTLPPRHAIHMPAAMAGPPQPHRRRPENALPNRTIRAPRRQLYPALLARVLGDDDDGVGEFARTLRAAQVPAGGAQVAGHGDEARVAVVAGVVEPAFLHDEVRLVAV